MKNDAQETESSRSSTGTRIAKTTIAVALLAFALLLGRDLARWLPQFVEWVEELGFWAPFAFIALYAVATVALVPGSLLTLAAGAVFGLVEGTLTVFAGASLGATLAFLASRSVARNAVRTFVERRLDLASVDRAIARQGFRIVLLLRLSPVFPFNILNFALGLTRVRLRDYVLASIGMLPATFLYVYYGNALGSLAAVAGGTSVERGTGYWIVLAGGLIATIAATILIARIAQRALAQEVEDD